MSANHRTETITEIAARGNIGMTCSGCGRKGVADGKTAARWFFVHRWDTHTARAGVHFRCIECGGTGTRFGLTHDRPTVPGWGPRSEADWKRVVARLRG
jgi:hypothetical protein